MPADAELSPHDPDVPDWNGLSDDEKRLYARFMEVYAGFLEHADHHLGRVLDTLEKLGELDNTLVMVISDNGASSEGGVSGAFNEMSSFNNRWETLDEVLPRIDELGGTRAYNHYPWGWSWAGNTPFRRWKKEVYRGGATDPFIVHWPAGIERGGEIRSQYAHAVDMVPDRPRRARHHAARRDRRRGAVAAGRGQLQPHVRRLRCADAAPHAVLRDVRAARDRPRRLACGLRLAGAELRRGSGARAQARRRHPALDARRARRVRLAAVPRRRGSRPRARTSPPSTPRSCAR